MPWLWIFLSALYFNKVYFLVAIINKGSLPAHQTPASTRAPVEIPSYLCHDVDTPCKYSWGSTCCDWPTWPADSHSLRFQPCQNDAKALPKHVQRLQWTGRHILGKFSFVTLVSKRRHCYWDYIFTHSPALKSLFLWHGSNNDVMWGIGDKVKR